MPGVPVLKQGAVVGDVEVAVLAQRAVDLVVAGGELAGRGRLGVDRDDREAAGRERVREAAQQLGDARARRGASRASRTR